jgi:uncharacterized protein (TIGR00369 family)
MTPEQIIRERFKRNNFIRLLGIELDSVERGRARLSLEVKDELLQLQGVLHGGAMAALIDTAVAIAISSASEPEARFTTVEMKINYLEPVRRGRVIADARLIRNGRRIAVAECDAYDSNGQLVAKGLLTYIKLNR